MVSNDRSAINADVKVIVVRGDLFSDAGYARATRALCAILATRCESLFGVSLHEHAARKQNAFPYPTIADVTLTDDPFFAGCVIINIALPNEFIYVPGAVNIGYFFWETEEFPLGQFWKAKLGLMDDIWAPSHWQSDVLRRATRRADVPVIPWPQVVPDDVSFDRTVLSGIKAHTPQSRAQLDSYRLRSSSLAADDFQKMLEEQENELGRGQRFDPARSQELLDVLGPGHDVFLAIQTDAPRKGLPLLIASWLQFKETPDGQDARLIIKMSSLDVSADVYRLHFHSSLAVRRLMRRLSVETSGIFFVYDRLGGEQMRALIAGADAFVSATMGEGFGGPLAEALLEKVPVICPSHTSCSDILGPDYPLAVSSQPHRQKLWNNIGVYSPSSVWNVIDDESLVLRLGEVARMSRAERVQVATDARRRLIAAVGVDTVTGLVRAALRKVSVPGALDMVARSTVRPATAIGR